MVTKVVDMKTGEPVQTKNESISRKLVKFATQQGAEFFHAPDGEALVQFTVKGHRETWPIGKDFKTWLTGAFYAAGNNPPNGNALNDAMAIFRAKAAEALPAIPVFTRVAAADDVIYFDLCDASWRAVRVDADGWQIIANPPVAFRRAKGMLPLAVPVRGGTLDELRPLLNVEDDAEWILIVGWLVGAAQGRGPYPILALYGEQGSAKSSTARRLRGVVDPATLVERAPPKDERDLAIAARNGHVLTYDNLSYLPPWLSDAFCRLATGGGIATRQLYSDDGETLFDAQRPMILNGIEEFATRGDLLSRSLIVTLPTIPDHQRRTERDLDKAFGDALPRILGALFDAVSAAIKNLPAIEMMDAPRMADFARWVVAAEPALGWEPGTFVRAYTANRASAQQSALDASVVASAVRRFAAQGFVVGRPASFKCTAWKGTATDLLGHLHCVATDEELASKSWPKAANALSGRLRRDAPALRGVGIEFTSLDHVGPSDARGILLEIRADDRRGGGTI